MSQIMKTFLGIFLLMLLIVSSLGIIDAGFQILSAQDFHSAAVSQMEASDFHPEVLKSCLEDAEARGYKMQLTLYLEDSREVKADQAEAIPEDTDACVRCMVETTFSMTIPLWGLTEPFTLTGYAR